MIKIDFQDLPNRTTPINAPNLNQMQDNIEDAIDEKVVDSYNTSTVKAYSAHYIDELIDGSGGYVKVGDVLIIYGTVSVNCSGQTATNTTITFPRSFANTNYSFVVTKSNAPYSTELYPTIGTKNTNKCVLNTYNSYSSTVAQNFNYMIIGDVAQ